MKKLYLVLIVFVLFVLGCSSSDQRYEKAKTIGSVLYQQHYGTNGNDDIFVVLDESSRLKIVYVSDRLFIYRVDYVDPRKVYFEPEKEGK